MARRFVPFLVIGVALLAPTPFVADDDAQAAGAPTAERAAPAAEGVPPEEGFARAPIRLDGIQQQAIGLTYGTVERRPLEQVIRTVGR
ncbi:MAG: hypothetical protein E6J69_15630, partial [Deltaproteobacteria bacterium]